MYKFMVGLGVAYAFVATVIYTLWLLSAHIPSLDVVGALREKVSLSDGPQSGQVSSRLPARILDFVPSVQTKQPPSPMPEREKDCVVVPKGLLDYWEIPYDPALQLDCVPPLAASEILNVLNAKVVEFSAEVAE